jgi:hypothetical protein
MKITAVVKLVRTAQPKPGDLFIVPKPPGPYVALAIKDMHTRDSLVLFLGPTSTKYQVPVVTEMPMSMPAFVSFEKNYRLRPSCEPSAWLAVEPPKGPCLVLQNSREEDKLYMRATLDYGGQTIPIYIDIRDGVILTDTSDRFKHLDGNCVYT